MRTRGLTRRAALRLTGTGAVAVGLAACSGDEKKQAGTTTSPQSSAPAGAAAAQVPSPPTYTQGRFQEMLSQYHWSKIGSQVQSLGTPRMGGVVAVATASFGLQSLHPTEEVLGQWPFCFTHSNLAAMDFSYTANPDLIPATPRYAASQSWEQPDATTLIFKLRPGVTWHNKAPANGAPLTVEDVRATYDFFKSSRLHGLHFKNLARIEETQPGVLRFVSTEPSAQLLGVLRTPSYALLNARQIEEGEESLRTKAIGTGPFTQERFQPNTNRVYKRNPNYWFKDELGNQLPYLDGVVTTIIGDPAAAVAAFRSGQIDYYRPTSVEEFDRLRRELDAYAQINVACGCQSNVVAPSSRDALFRDVRVRRALSLAVNRTDIIETVFGGAATDKDWVPWYYRGLNWPDPLDKQGPWYKHDPAQAKQLLQAAGVQSPVKVEVNFSGQVSPGTGTAVGNPFLDSVSRDLKAVGIELELKPTDVLGADRLYYGGQWSGLFARSISAGASLDADIFLQALFTGTALNGLGVSDPTYDDLFRRQRAAFDVNERMKVFNEIENYVNRDQMLRGAQLPQGFAYGLWRKYMHNALDTTSWWLNGGSGQQFTQIWIDDKAPKRNIDSF